MTFNHGDTSKCYICRRAHDAIAVGKEPPKWICNTCLKATKGKLLMAKIQWDKYEARALETAGYKAGEYLDSIGKTNLATLSIDEWLAFLRCVIDSFGDAMRDQVPF